MTRAAVCTAVNRPLEVAQLDLASPAAGEISVRIGASGICGSDATVLKGLLPSPMPIVLGHEAAGVVTAVGRGVESVAEGDHVVVTAMPQCGVCWRCDRNQASLCEVGDSVLVTGAMRDGTHRFRTSDGVDVAQMVAAGTFAEEVVISEISAVKIPKDIPFAPASLIGCGVITGFGAAMNAASIEPGRAVVVIGCGSVGLSALQAARLAGAEQLVAIDVVRSKLEIATRLGATSTVPGGEDVVAAIRELTGGRGADVTIDCVGVQSTVDQAIRMTAKGGEIVFVGANDPTCRIDVPQFAALVGPAKTFRGVLFGNADIRRDVPRIVGAYQAGTFDLDVLVSRTFTLDEVNVGLAALGSEVVSAVVQL